MNLYTEIYQENNNKVNFLGRYVHKDSIEIYFYFLFLYKFICIFEFGANSWDLKEFKNIKEK
jgi:hypothetical protein